MTAWRSLNATLEHFFRPHAIYTDDQTVLIGGEQTPREALLSGDVDRAMREMKATLFVSELSDSAWTKNVLGPGVVVSVSAPESGAIYALCRHPGASTGSTLFHSVKSLADYVQLPLPGGEFERIQFLSAARGYLWGRAGLYRTVDGRFWEETFDLESNAIVSIATEGSAWIAIGEKVARIGADNNRPSKIVQGLPGRVTGLFAAHPEEAWVLVQNGGNLEIYSLTSGGNLRLRHRANDRTGEFLGGGGHRIVAATTDPTSAPPRAGVLLSEDGGATWHEQPPPSPSCVLPMAVGRAGTLVSYGAMGRVHVLPP